jgi:hypothetical protein
MVEENTKAEEVKAPTEAELRAMLDKAYASKDWKEISKVAQEINKHEKAKEAAEKEKFLKDLEAKTEKVKVAITKAVKPLVDSGELDKADGIWFTQDFGEKLVACRLTKTAPRKGGGGGGGGKKFDVSTEDLLDKYGGEQYKDGKTFKQAFDEDADKNKRYSVRQALLKKGGYIK